jgi:hypothetical protein
MSDPRPPPYEHTDPEHPGSGCWGCTPLSHELDWFRAELEEAKRERDSQHTLMVEASIRAEKAEAALQSAEARGYRAGFLEGVWKSLDVVINNGPDFPVERELRSLLPRPDAEPVATTTEKEGTDE